MIIIDWGAWYFGTSGKKKMIQKFSVAWGKSESNLKLLKDKIPQVNNFLLLNFGLFFL